MMTKDLPAGGDDIPRTSNLPPRSLAAPVTAGVVSWAAIALGFLGLKMLMQERPQFVGEPMRVSKVELIQESPRIVARKVTDDISVIKPAQPELSEIRFDMRGRRDYRGLKTIMDMSGEFRARHTLTNTFDEPIFVLFKSPHPRTESGTGQGLLASGLKMQASVSGSQENSKDAWFWSGTVGAHGSLTIDISYQVGSLKGVTYRVGEQNGNPVKQLRVTFQRQDLASMRFESGDGTMAGPEDTVVWERRDFLAPDFFSANIVESGNLYVSLTHLLEIGPLVCLLFLLAVSAIILGRQSLTAVQMLTISAAYALYFPLILYLSSRFTFVVAVVIAVAVPGALLVNYARWLLGSKIGLLGGPLFLGLYQVFPTLAAFGGWNRGMVLLCLGVVTLWVLINLQNQALRRKASASGLAAYLIFSCPAHAAEIQIVLPGDLAAKFLEPKREAAISLLAFETAQYEIRHEATHFQVEARLAIEILRTGDAPSTLFGVPVHVQEIHLESAEPNLARLVTVTNRLGLFGQRPGHAKLRLSYRVPVESRDGKKQARIPLFIGPAGNVRLATSRNDLEILRGSLWGKASVDQAMIYNIGVAGEELLVIEWRDLDGDSPLGTGRAGERSKEFYGIGLTRSQNLTVINSDGGCTHFAELELPPYQTEEFRLQLPSSARLISVSVNGNEVASPTIEGQLCHIRLPAPEAQRTSHRLSFRIAYPKVDLGFAGMAELALPEVFQTAGTLEWVVALPNGFETQVITSGLETQKTAPDLSRFGDYGRILKSHPHTYLAKDLAPPGLVNLSLKYRQLIPGMYEARKD